MYFFLQLWLGYKGFDFAMIKMEFEGTEAHVTMVLMGIQAHNGNLRSISDKLSKPIHF